MFMLVLKRMPPLSGSHARTFGSKTGAFYREMVGLAAGSDAPAGQCQLRCSDKHHDLVLVEGRNASDAHVLALPLAYVYARRVLVFASAAPGDAFIFHGACHNPTGIDPTAAEWGAIADAVAARGILPILDFAYQGLGDGLVEDAASLRTFLATGCEILVAASASKNFALYDERVGALAIVAADAPAAAAILTHAKVAIRAAWSNPPGHGGEIVAEILGDDALRAQWEGEVTAMRDRINGNRRAFVAALAGEGASDVSHLLTGRGMFSLLGLDDAQLAALRDKQAIYLVSRGRINFAGLSAVKIPIVAKAVAALLR